MAAGERELSLDRVLCNPRLASEFDELAKSIVPGHSSVEYRWAAMTLRKARRARTKADALPRFEYIGGADSIRVRSLPSSPGVYVAVTPTTSLFVGVAENLRVQVDSLVGAVGPQVVPTCIDDRHDEVAQFHLLEMPKTSPKLREEYRSLSIKKAGSRLNFLMGPLFRPAQRSSVA